MNYPIPVVEMEGVTFAYQHEPTLEGIELTVARGEYLAIVGPNGSGKSTLLRLMLGRLQPQKGRVKLFGVPVREFTRWPRVGYISQQARNFNQSFPATVREIVGSKLHQEMGLLKSINPRLEEKVVTALKQVEMDGYLSRKVGDLSGGQQQRVFIARVLVSEPEVIFLDEPLAGLDQAAQEGFFRLLDRLNNRLGITLVLISHDLHVVSRQADRIACLEGGKVFLHSPGELNCRYIEGGFFIPEHGHGKED
ncbi:MAG: metal ABC transporter ATP-binding protein [Halanaerobium sp.]|nr:metal ABC transporter ATP-binding protein [Halanaerobium sp.]